MTLKELKRWIRLHLPIRFTVIHWGEIHGDGPRVDRQVLFPWDSIAIVDATSGEKTLTLKYSAPFAVTLEIHKSKEPVNESD